MNRRTFITSVAAGALPAVLALGCRRASVDHMPPVEALGGDLWIQPANAEDDPHWGFKNGIAVGLWPTDGPRGLIRIYTPYLCQSFQRVVNFIAVEPVVQGQRGQSELEVG